MQIRLYIHVYSLKKAANYKQQNIQTKLKHTQAHHTPCTEAVTLGMLLTYMHMHPSDPVTK